ncbi:SGNH/GDSL hydrolase family protein [Alphaproteobacteria bacterium]|nr:SGNH/GDSL hydrolase family protein [Alphaproteobacteria bacterium]
MGGSTTDGWYSQYSSGQTWPKILDDICSENSKDYNNCSVINGGVGGYNSSQELLKLLTSAAILDQNLKIIISFNGINEMEGYRGTNNFIETNLPFFTSEMASMYTNEKWFRQSNNIINFFPNINSFFRYLLGTLSSNLEKSSKLTKKDFKDIYNKSSKINSVIERWNFNTSMMKKISDQLESSYIVILQPTLGLLNNNHNIPNGSKDFYLFQTLDLDYIKNINFLYENLRIECSKKNYCFDLSKIILPNGSSYFDPRHHNELGNKKIVEEIIKIIKNDLVKSYN